MKMQSYELELKQSVDYPRCRIYRGFIQNLMADRNIRVNGDNYLFYFTVLCSYANFRTSYRCLDGITYTIYPGEWVFRLTELKEYLRVHSRQRLFDILADLYNRGLIRYSLLGHDHIVKCTIRGWARFNKILDYNCPCQKNSGFFFLPISIASELISAGRCSEMDIILDLWFSAVYNDERVIGSE